MPTVAEVDDAAAVSGKRELIRHLVATGQRHLFGLPGSSMVAPLNELQSTDIEFVPAIHESVAVAAADGYARVAGHATVLLYMLPGMANGLGNLYNAWRDESPLTVIASQQATRHRSIDATVGEADLVGLARPFTRLAHEIAPGMDLGFWLERARAVSTGQVPGPVFLSIPENVFDEPVTVTNSRASRNDCAIVPDVAKVAEALGEAERPLIVVGGQLRRFGGAQVLEDLSEKHGIAVAYEPGFQDRLGIAPGHENAFGNLLLLPEMEAEADVVVVLGGRLLLEAHPRPAWFAGATFLAHVNADPFKLEETKVADWACACDPAQFVRTLHGTMTEFEGQEAVRARRKAWLDTLRAQSGSGSGDQAFASYACVVGALHDALDQGWVVDEAVMASPVLHAALSSLDGRRFVGTAGGSLGWGPAAAAGVAIASGEPVTCIVGDGALRFGALGLWTIRSCNLPVTIVVLDNGGYGSTRFFERQYVARLQERGGGNPPGYLGSNLRDAGSTVESIIEGFGIPVSVVREGEDPREAVERAWAARIRGPNAVVVQMGFK